jgi:hypothetical protein
MHNKKTVEAKRHRLELIAISVMLVASMFVYFTGGSVGVLTLIGVFTIVFILSKRRKKSNYTSKTRNSYERSSDSGRFQ